MCFRNRVDMDISNYICSFGAVFSKIKIYQTYLKFQKKMFIGNKFKLQLDAQNRSEVIIRNFIPPIFLQFLILKAEWFAPGFNTENFLTENRLFN